MKKSKKPVLRNSRPFNQTVRFKRFLKKLFLSLKKLERTWVHSMDRFAREERKMREYRNNDLLKYGDEFWRRWL